MSFCSLVVFMNYLKQNMFVLKLKSEIDSKITETFESIYDMSQKSESLKIQFFKNEFSLQF